MGETITAPDYVEAQHAALELGRDVEEWFASGYDLLLTPTLGEPPVELGTFSTPDEPLARVHARRDLRAVHAAREHDGRARDLAAVALERRRPADRRRS